MDIALLVTLALVGAILLATIHVVRSKRRRRHYGSGDPDGSGFDGGYSGGDSGGGDGGVGD